MKETHAIDEVLEFYRALPFNYRESVEEQVKAIRARNTIETYPPLAALLSKGTRVLEVGCGSGWLSNGMNHHYGAAVTGLDFNPIAVERASLVAEGLDAQTKFVVADLYKYIPQTPFDVVVSLGVLHHTADCMAGVRHICRHCIAEDGHVMIGLYHKYGRKPFLDHFKDLADAGVSEKKMLKEYGKLHSSIKDKVLLMSWFRDQVLHPHETQHTQAELDEVLTSEGLEIISSSLNKFQPFTDPKELYPLEPELEQVGRDMLKKKQYYPGFFVVLAKKNAQ